MKADLKIGDLIEVPPVKTVIRLEDGVERSESIIDGFVVTADVDSHLTVISESIAQNRGRGYFLQGDFGSGKSHFLAALHAWIERYPGHDLLTDRHGGLKRLAGMNPNILAVSISLVNYRAAASFEQIVIEALESALANKGVQVKLTPQSRFLDNLAVLIKDPDTAAEFAVQAGIPVSGIHSFLMEDPGRAYILGLQLYKRLGIERPESMAGDRSDMFRRAFDAVLKAGFKGVLIIIDELSEFFRSKPDARSLNEDARTLQLLGELAGENPIWIIAALQESIERTGDISQVTFRKIKDRFPVKLSLTTIHIKALLSGRLVRRKPGAEKALEDVHRYLKRHFSTFNESFSDFLAVYPVHPVTIALLDGLGDLFSEHRGIVDFVHSRIAGNPDRRIPGILDRPAYELLAPDSIYDHFAQRMAEFSAFNVYPRHIMPHFQAVIGRTIENPDDRRTAERIIKILMLHAIHPTADFPTVRQAAEWSACAVWEHDPAMNVQFAAEVLLDPLVDQSRFLIKRKADNPLDTVYEIITRENPLKNLKARIDRRMSEIPEDDTRLLLFPLTITEESAAWPGREMFDEGAPRMITWRRTTRKAWVVFVSPERTSEIESMLDEKIETGVVDFAMAVCIGETAIASKYTAVWRINLPSDDRASYTLREFLAARFVYKGLDPGNPADTNLMEPVQEMIDKSAPGARQTALDLFYAGKFDNPSVPYDRTIQRLKRFDRLVEWAGEALLENRYSAFRDIEPKKVSPSPMLYKRIIEEFIAPGSISIRKAGTTGVIDAIDGLAAPLGLVELKSGTYVSAPDPDRHPLIAAVFGMMNAARKTPVSRVLKSLQTGRFGLPADTAKFLLTALAYSGLIMVIRSGRPVPADQLDMLRIDTADDIAPGGIIGKQDRDALQNECYFLAPAGGWTSFGLKQQRDAWRNVISFSKWAEKTAELKSRIRQYVEYSAFSEFDFDELIRKIDGFVLLGAAVDPSLQAGEGLERFLDAWRRSELCADDIERIKTAELFFTRFAEQFTFISHYARHDAVVEAAERNELIGNQAGKLKEALNDNGLIISKDRMRRLNDLFDSFKAEYTAFYKERHDAWYRKTYEKPLSDYSKRALMLLKRLSAIDALDRPESLETLLNAFDSRRTMCCRRNPDEELIRSPICGCGFMPGKAPLQQPFDEDPETALEKMLEQYLSILKSPKILEAFAARGFALKDARPDVADRLRRLSASLRSETPSTVVLMDLFDTGLAQEISGALSGRISIEKRSITDLVRHLSGRRLASYQIMDTVKSWISEAGEDSVIAIDQNLKSDGRESIDDFFWWPLLHGRLLDQHIDKASLEKNIRRTETALERSYPSAELYKSFACSDTMTLLQFVAEERFHMQALRIAWLILAERIVSGEQWPKDGDTLLSLYGIRETADKISARLKNLKELPEIKRAPFPDRLRARIPLSEIVVDPWVSKDLRSYVFNAIRDIEKQGDEWLSATPSRGRLPLSDNPVVMILDGVSPDVWIDAYRRLEERFGSFEWAWRKIDTGSSTVDSMSEMFGVAKDPMDAFVESGIDYYQVKGSESQRVIDLFPEIKEDRPTVIRVALIDDGAHRSFLRLAQMPESVFRFLNQALNDFLDICRRGKKTFILTTDHGLSLTPSGLSHGKGGVYEKTVFLVKISV